MHFDLYSLYNDTKTLKGTVCKIVAKTAAGQIQNSAAGDFPSCSPSDMRLPDSLTLTSALLQPFVFSLYATG